MKFITEIGFDVKEGQSRPFQEWLLDNEAELRETCPDGVEYLGTFWTIFGSDRSGGSCRTLWSLDSYGAQDRFTDAMKAGGRFADLVEGHTSFIDQRNDANGSTALHRSVTDAAVWGD